MCAKYDEVPHACVPAVRQTYVCDHILQDMLGLYIMYLRLCGQLGAALTTIQAVRAGKPFECCMICSTSSSHICLLVALFRAIVYGKSASGCHQAVTLCTARQYLERAGLGPCYLPECRTVGLSSRLCIVLNAAMVLRDS